MFIRGLATARNPGTLDVIVVFLFSRASSSLSYRRCLPFQVKETLNQGSSEDLLDKEIDITTLAPRKPDWDLKRDIAERLKKLERRQSRAVAELIRERLRENKEDLARVVQNAQPDADEDED